MPSVAGVSGYREKTTRKVGNNARGTSGRCVISASSTKTEPFGALFHKENSVDLNLINYIEAQNSEVDVTTIYYFNASVSHDGPFDDIANVLMQMTSFVVKCDMDLDESILKIKNLLNEFPISNKSLDETKLEIAIRSRRGRGNIEYEDFVWYKGTGSYASFMPMVDGPIGLIKLNGKYGVFRHPQFENYGFKLNVQI